MRTIRGLPMTLWAIAEDLTLGHLGQPLKMALTGSTAKWHNPNQWLAKYTRPHPVIFFRFFGFGFITSSWFLFLFQIYFYLFCIAASIPFHHSDSIRFGKGMLICSGKWGGTNSVMLCSWLVVHGALVHSGNVGSFWLRVTMTQWKLAPLFPCRLNCNAQSAHSPFSKSDATWTSAHVKRQTSCCMAWLITLRVISKQHKLLIYSFQSTLDSTVGKKVNFFKLQQHK